jgi:hypothetical protein
MAKQHPLASTGGGGGARNSGGISGNSGKNVNPVNKPTGAKIKKSDKPVLPPTAKQLRDHYRELFNQWNH